MEWVDLDFVWIICDFLNKFFQTKAIIQIDKAIIQIDKVIIQIDKVIIEMDEAIIEMDRYWSEGN